MTLLGRIHAALPLSAVQVGGRPRRRRSGRHVQDSTARHAEPAASAVEVAVAEGGDDTTGTGPVRQAIRALDAAPLPAGPAQGIAPAASSRPLLRTRRMVRMAGGFNHS